MPKPSRFRMRPCASPTCLNDLPAGDETLCTDCRNPQSRSEMAQSTESTTGPRMITYDRFPGISVEAPERVGPSGLVWSAEALHEQLKATALEYQHRFSQIESQLTVVSPKDKTSSPQPESSNRPGTANLLTRPRSAKVNRPTPYDRDIKSRARHITPSPANPFTPAPPILAKIKYRPVYKYMRTASAESSSLAPVPEPTKHQSPPARE